MPEHRLNDLDVRPGRDREAGGSVTEFVCGVDERDLHAPVTLATAVRRVRS
jgi:hypothetical protein